MTRLQGRRRAWRCHLAQTRRRVQATARPAWASSFRPTRTKAPTAVWWGACESTKPSGANGATCSAVTFFGVLQRSMQCGALLGVLPGVIVPFQLVACRVCTDSHRFAARPHLPSGPTLCLDLEAARAPGSAYKTASEAVPGAGPLQGTAGAAGKVEEGPQSQSAGGERTPARTGSTSISSMTCSSGCNREHGSGQGVGTRVGSGAARGVAAAALQEVHAQQDGQQGSVETSAPDGPALVTVAGITLGACRSGTSEWA